MKRTPSAEVVSSFEIVLAKLLKHVRMVRGVRAGRSYLVLVRSSGCVDDLSQVSRISLLGLHQAASDILCSAAGQWPGGSDEPFPHIWSGVALFEQQRGDAGDVGHRETGSSREVVTWTTGVFR